MKECWRDDPGLRPSFAEIVERISRHIEDHINTESGNSSQSTVTLAPITDTLTMPNLASTNSSSPNDIATSKSDVTIKKKPTKVEESENKKWSEGVVKKAPDQPNMFVWKDTPQPASNSAVQCFLKLEDAIWVGDAHGKAILYNKTSGVQLDQFEVSKKTSQVNALLAVDDTVWIVIDNLICIFQFKKKWKNVKILKKHKKTISSIISVPSPSGEQVWSCDIAGTILVWNPKKKKFVRELIACEDAIYSMSVVDKSVWMGGFAEVFRVNLNTWEMINWRAHNSAIISIVWDSTQNLVWTSSHDNTVKIWQQGATLASPATMVSEIALAQSVGSTMALSSHPVNKFVCLGQSDGHVSVWDIKRHRKLYEWKAHEKDVQAIQFVFDEAQNAAYLWTGALDGSLSVWLLNSKFQFQSAS